LQFTFEVKKQKQKKTISLKEYRVTTIKIYREVVGREVEVVVWKS
jgi:hypothetical protein